MEKSTVTISACKDLQVLIVTVDFFHLQSTSHFWHHNEVYVDKELLILIHYLFWVCTCEGS